MKLFDLTGQVCVVTGSTKGIGRATAERMAEHGAKVVVTSRRIEDAERAAGEINEAAQREAAIGAKFELSEAGDGERLVERAVARCGRIDAVVGNAAHLAFGRLKDIDLASFNEMLSANVVNHAGLARASASVMAAQGGGAIVLVLSSLGFFASRSYLTYGVSKAAMAHMTRVLAVDLGADNIRVNAVAPGSIQTSSRFHDNAEMSRLLVGDIPLRRPGEPDEIAAAILFLVSRGGAYTTGQCLIVDGGQTLRGMEGAERAFEALGAARARAGGTPNG